MVPARSNVTIHISFVEKLKFFIVILAFRECFSFAETPTGTLTSTSLGIAFFLFYQLLFAPWGVHWKKTWGRLLDIIFTRYMTEYASPAQIQWAAPTSQAQYVAWCRLRKTDLIIDEVGNDGGKLMWVGPKRLDRVVLYIHGE